MKPRIGVIAPASPISPIELRLGVEQIQTAGFDVTVHAQCKKKGFLFAGSDEERAQAFYEGAKNPAVEVLWCARGGYGGARILPLLEKLSRERGMPPTGKLLVGYSDATVFFEFVQKRWGWSVLHAPMPGMREFLGLSARERKLLWAYVGREAAAWQLAKQGVLSQIRVMGEQAFPQGEVTGGVAGGNLSVLTSLVGTPYFPDLQGQFLFIEDVSEPLYRIDRMVMQLRLSGLTQGVSALLLGNFLGCEDRVSQVLKQVPKNKRAHRPSELGPLRKTVGAKAGLIRIFSEWATELRVPLLGFLPVGHGPGRSPLPIGMHCKLTREEGFQSMDWNWIRASPD